MPKTLKNKHQFKKNKTHKIRGGGFFDSFNFFKKDDLPFMYFYNFEITKADGKTVEEKEEDEKAVENPDEKPVENTVKMTRINPDENPTQIEVVTDEKADGNQVKMTRINPDENPTQIEVVTGEKPFDETPKNQVEEKVVENPADRKTKPMKKLRINEALNTKHGGKKK